MKAIFCLGNIGARYAATPHNAGFMAGEKLLVLAKARFKRSILLKSEIGEFKTSRARVIVARPTTYMNLSGQAIRAVMRRFKVAKEDILVLHDDIELALGSFKFSGHCKKAFHNGIDSVIEALHADDFARVRIGIGPKPKTIALKEYVLRALSEEQYRALEETAHAVAEACMVWARDGFTKAVNVFNRRDTHSISRKGGV